MKAKPVEGQTCTFQILFTSDVHGAFRDYNYTLNRTTPQSGIAKMATLMRKEKENFDGQTFMVDVGDIIQGNGTSPLVRLEQLGQTFRPFPLLAAYDAIGYDIVSIGNHEFNFGIPALLNAFAGYKGEKLCGNVFAEGKALLDGFEAYTVKTLDCGLRVAFVGVVSPNVKVWDRANLKDHYAAANAAMAAGIIIDHIRSDDLADVIILLGHMHTDNELNRPGSGAKDVAAMNQDIDLFLGAHFHQRVGAKDAQHTLLDTMKFAENLDSAKSFGKALITATFENGKWRVKKPLGDYDESDIKTDIITIGNDQTVENDAAVMRVTEDADKCLKAYLQEKIGVMSGGPLVPEPEIKGTNEAILRPTPLIHLIGNIMRQFAGTDLASASLNNYDANCPEGTITLGSIIRMFVYDNNKIYKLAMTGRQVKQWMEWSYAFFGTPVNGKPDVQNPAVNPETDLTIPYGTRKVYLHDKFVGLNYDVDLTKPVGARIHVTGMADGSAFDEAKTYTVATTNYRASTALTMHAEEGVFPNLSEPLAEVLEMDVRSPKGHINVLDWIKEYISGQPENTIRNDVEDNWRFVNLAWDDALRRKALELINDGKLAYDFTKPVKKTDIAGM